MIELLNMRGFTPREYYRMYGTLPDTTIEALIDTYEDSEVASAANPLAYLQDAKAQFPEEDFLQDAIKRMQQLAKQVRGANREEAQGIIKMLEQIQQTTHHATDQGLDDIRNAEKELKK